MELSRYASGICLKNADRGSISRQLKKTGKCLARINVAALGPVYKLRHINTPVGSLAVEDPTLRLFHSLAQITLRQPGFLTQSSQESRQALVCRSVLGLGSHLTRLSCQSFLTRFACQPTLDPVVSSKTVAERASSVAVATGTHSEKQGMSGFFLA